MPYKKPNQSTKKSNPLESLRRKRNKSPLEQALARLELKQGTFKGGVRIRIRKRKPRYIKKSARACETVFVLTTPLAQAWHGELRKVRFKLRNGAEVAVVEVLRADTSAPNRWEHIDNPDVTEWQEDICKWLGGKEFSQNNWLHNAEMGSRKPSKKQLMEFKKRYLAEVL